MEYVLILFLMAGHTAVVPGFISQQQCETAGQHTLDKAWGKDHMAYACVQRGGDIPIKVQECIMHQHIGMEEIVCPTTTFVIRGERK